MPIVPNSSDIVPKTVHISRADDGQSGDDGVSCLGSVADLSIVPPSLSHQPDDLLARGMSTLSLAFGGGTAEQEQERAAEQERAVEQERTVKP